MKLDSLKKESIQDIRKKFSSFFLKVGWILMFVGTPIGSGIGALPFLLAGRLLKGDLKIKKDTLFLLTNLFLLTLPISILNAKRKLFAFWWVIAFGLTLYLVLFGAKYLIKEKYFLNKLAIIFIVCSVVSSIYGLTIYFSRLDCRTHTLFANPNEFGTILIPALIITLAFFTQTPGKGKILLGGGLSLILTSLFFSFSRGAWLGAIVALLVYGVYQRKDLL
ncbi:hypothetical protein J7K97_00850, partial [Candidatus Aerophobetes bacterium]|nr:hypothetical protein [Candidatus Aerophobetes bacterium]